MSEPLRLREIEEVQASTGMSRERILELRETPESTITDPFLAADWAEANAIAADVGAELVANLLERFGPASSRRIHDTGIGPIRGIDAGPSAETHRSGCGPCQKCDHVGELRLVHDRWLCEDHARRRESDERFRARVKAA
jgi:hypothetical protein